MEGNERLISLLKQRREWATAKAEAEKMLKIIDPEIIVELIQAGYEKEKLTYDGYTFKVGEGVNTYIGEADVRKTLLALELGVEEIDWIVEQVKRETPYTYVDMRKEGKGKGKGEKED